MKTNEFRIAIVGAGPSGYFAAQAFQSLRDSQMDFAIDMFERLPTPWGLVRNGVAPDHPQIKSISKVFEKISDDHNFRLFANVEVGRDIALETLQSTYDAVFLAVGTPIGRHLGIPGEDLSNCVSAAQFVPWYNGHPNFSDLLLNLSGKRAIIIGAGNVALDVARILCSNPFDLSKTDIADYAQKALEVSTLSEVMLCARRGAEFSSFTAQELRELSKLKETRVDISKEHILEARAHVGKTNDRFVSTKLDVMEKISNENKSEIGKTLKFNFGFVPKVINGDKRVKSVTFSTSSGIIEVQADLVITAIGYDVASLSKLKIEKNHFKNTNGFVEKNLFVVGWAKRGSSGVIGTNKSDSYSVVKLAVERLRGVTPKYDSRLQAILATLPSINLREWRFINEFEISEGVKSGRPRSKITSVEGLLSVVRTKTSISGN